VGIEAAVHCGGRVTVFPARVRRNADAIRRGFGRELICVVKGDAYGHGIDAIAPALAGAGYRAYAVASAQEHSRVRAACGDAEVMILRPEFGSWQPFPPDPTGRTSAVVGARTFAAVREHHRDDPAEIQLEIDCGIGRGGVPAADVCEAVRRTHRSGGVTITGLVAHFPGQLPREERLFIVDQLRRAEELGRDRGMVVSIGGSDALRWAQDAPPHWPVRVGRMLYGAAPAWLSCHELAASCSWSAEAYILPATRTAGYASRELSPAAPAHIAVGFAHGLPPAAAGAWPVRIAGHWYRIGEVFMMSSLAYPAGAALSPGTCAEALLCGQSDHDCVPVRAVADALGWSTTAVLLAPRPASRTVAED
jgi:alanine racemase